MKKREEFAVSLRKKKTHDLINAKRRKLMISNQGPSSMDQPQTNEESKAVASQEGTAGNASQNTMYKGYHMFEHDSELFEKMLSELCPYAAQANQVLDQNQVNIVSDDQNALSRLQSLRTT